MRKKDWKNYEDIVIKILKSNVFYYSFNESDSYSFVDAIDTKGFVFRKGDGTKLIKHQIDVQLYNSKDDIYLYGECKYHSSRVEKNEVSSFLKIIDNIREYEPSKRIIPIFISNSPFNEGAIDMMEHYCCDYLIFSYINRPHFRIKDIKIHYFWCGKKKYSYSKESTFYNEYHGSPESLEITINMFWTYKSGRKFFNQKRCKKDKTYNIQCSDPTVDIIFIDSMELKKQNRVTKVQFEYKHEKLKTEITNPEIGMIRMNNENYVVYEDLTIRKFLKINC